MSNIYIYGDILYKSMSYIKGKCSNKRMTYKFKNEVVNYINLWNLCLIFLLDESINKSDKISFLTRYINENKNKFTNVDINFEKIDYSSYVSFPLEAIELMINCIAEININILNYKHNFRKINNFIFALHNLPRCMLNPQLKEYIGQKEAIEYSLSYLNKSTL